MKRIHYPGQRLLWGTIVLFLLLFSMSSAALATDFRGGERVVIEAGEVIDDDLFVSGEYVTINGTVKGDLFAVGSYVTINGTVEGSLFAGGQTVTVNGPVEGSLYAGGYTVTLSESASVGRNLYAGGFSIKTQTGSSIGRDVNAGGYQIALNGDLAGDVNTGSAALEINGSVGGDVNAEVDTGSGGDMPQMMPMIPGMDGAAVEMLAPGYRTGPNAEIGGATNIVETSSQTRGGEQDAGASIVSSIGRGLLNRLGEFIAILLIGGLFMQLLPGWLQRLAGVAQQAALPSAGWGCITLIGFLIAVPIAGIILFGVAALGGLVTFGQLFSPVLSIGGAGLSLVIAVFSFIVWLVSKVIVSYLVGYLILARTTQIEFQTFGNHMAALALGAFVYQILRLIPVIGWLVAAATILIGVGTIYVVIRGELGSDNNDTPSAAVAVSGNAT